MCGGLAKNPIYVQMHADFTGKLLLNIENHFINDDLAHVFFVS